MSEMDVQALQESFEGLYVGRARTIRWMETDYVVSEDPYGNEADAMDSLAPGDVIVHSTDYAGTNAPRGQLMSTVARSRGALGCICDSQIRDSATSSSWRLRCSIGGSAQLTAWVAGAPWRTTCRCAAARAWFIRATSSSPISTGSCSP
jgi:hypothetical protein